MTTTANLGLGKPEAEDSYGDFIPQIFGDNMDTIDSALNSITADLGGFSFKCLTADEYIALGTYDSKTVYFVEDNGKITQYLGEVKLSGGDVVPSPAAIQIDSAVPAALIDVSLSGTAYPLTADNWDFFQNGEVGGCEFGDGYMRLYSNVIVGYAWTFLQSAVRVDLTGVNSIAASVRTKAGTQYNTYLAVAENTVEGSEKDGGLMNARTACAKSDDRQIVTLDVSGLSGYHYIEIVADYLTEIYVYDLRLQ